MLPSSPVPLERSTVRSLEEVLPVTKYLPAGVIVSDSGAEPTVNGEPEMRLSTPVL